MLDAEGKLLYVGKARDLKKRVSQYFRKSNQSVRNRSMMEKTDRIEVTVTGSEVEALLLESNLIKEFRPRYNVTLRDDKSYPYVYVSTDREYPALAFHRGARRGKGRYFGPYSNAGAVRETLGQLQKLFRVRQCEDTFFRNRSRPCLQYQIRRCTAPCVGRIGPDAYRADVDHAIKFLEGRSEEVVQELVRRMESTSAALDFESAARYRDQIEQLRRVTERQYVSGESGDLDIIACEVEAAVACVQVFQVRSGLNLGNTGYFPRLPEAMTHGEVMSAFLGQYYVDKEVPPQIILSHSPADSGALSEMLANRRGRAVGLVATVRGERARWLAMARRNAAIALKVHNASAVDQARRLESLQEALGLDFLPRRIECFDISHTAGEATVASCVVFDEGGAVKSDYRRFNISDIEPGDDYAAMRQALERRYRRLRRGEGKLPDLLLIDGGKGQLRQAAEVLEELQVEGVLIAGVAKGEGRRQENDRIVLRGADAPTILPRHSPALRLIQQVRDEAHRFAVTGHRQRRARVRSSSRLEEIRGLGPKRRQSLLMQFGGLRGVARAGVEELARAPGISQRLARAIYDHLHEDTK